MDFSFVHTADIHLDSPLYGLERYEGAPGESIRGAVRRAFDRLIDLCIDENVDFLVIAGDLFDGDWKDYNTGLYFASRMGVLREAGVQVYIIRGNHDAASQISRQLRFPDNVHIFGTEAETVINDSCGVALHGVSFVRPAVTEDLSLQYPAPIPEMFNIGLLHTCISGRPGHEPYAPCRTEYLITKGYDYWALGHVHQAEVVRDRFPCIVFPGNIQGRHIRESGNKGCTLVRVQGGQVQSLEHRDLDVLRWLVCPIDAASFDTIDDLYESAASEMGYTLQKSDGLFTVMRLQIEGQSPLDHLLRNRREEVSNNLRAMAVDYWRDEIWLEKIRIETTSPRQAGVSSGELEAAAFIREYISTLAADDALFPEIIQDLRNLRSLLGPSMLAGELGQYLQNPERLRDLLPDAEAIVLGRFNREE